MHQGKGGRFGESWLLGAYCPTLGPILVSNSPY